MPLPIAIPTGNSDLLIPPTNSMMTGNPQLDMLLLLDQLLGGVGASAFTTFGSAPPGGGGPPGGGPPTSVDDFTQVDPDDVTGVPGSPQSPAPPPGLTLDPLLGIASAMEAMVQGQGGQLASGPAPPGVGLPPSNDPVDGPRGEFALGEPFGGGTLGVGSGQAPRVDLGGGLAPQVPPTGGGPLMSGLVPGPQAMGAGLGLQGNPMDELLRRRIMSRRAGGSSGPTNQGGGGQG